MSNAILTDLTRCVGCGACTIACKEINELPRTEVDRLTSQTWCALRQEQGLYVKRQCMHCLDPTCASVCPVGAMKKTAYGSVNYDASKCFGCRYCMLACPFSIPKYQWHEQLPRVGKCVMCTEKRLALGRQPACTEVCPAGASVFGRRDTLVSLARERIAAQPDHYVNQIYGLNIAGGTSVLYLSSVPFEKLGFPTDLIGTAYPKLTWAVLSKIPYIASIAGLSLFAVYWTIERRIKLSRVQGHSENGQGGGHAS